ncbi:histone H4 transcription factor-like [Branchiostoma floridae x Branchiostoma japonicum]
MPQQKLSDQPMSLVCEWASCQTVYVNVDSFMRHIREHHYPHFTPAQKDRPDMPDEYFCQWMDCGAFAGNFPESLLRHTYYHAHHAKLKWLGMQVARNNQENHCLLDKQNHNYLVDIPDRMQCSWEDCGAIVDNPEHYFRHVEMHAMSSDHPNGPSNMPMVPCKWAGCQSCFKNKFKLKEHMRVHTQEKLFACWICGGLFSNRTKFMDHIKRQAAPEDQSYQCSHCSKRFSTERLLRDHMRHHVNHYKCPHCDMTCPTPSGLRSHIKFRHEEDRPYQCEFCHYKCKTNYDLRRHMDSHSVEKIYQCQQCDYSSKAYNSLRDHLRKDHQGGGAVQRYLCHICQKVYSRGTGLTRHLKTAHKFKWPSGHSRFRYKEHDDGYLRLQTIRYESVELTEMLMKPQSEQESPDVSDRDSVPSPIPHSGKDTPQDGSTESVPSPIHPCIPPPENYHSKGSTTLEDMNQEGALLQNSQVSITLQDASISQDGHVDNHAGVVLDPSTVHTDAAHILASVATHQPLGTFSDNLVAVGSNHAVPGGSMPSCGQVEGTAVVPHTHPTELLWQVLPTPGGHQEVSMHQPVSTLTLQTGGAQEVVYSMVEITTDGNMVTTQPVMTGNSLGGHAVGQREEVSLSTLKQTAEEMGIQVIGFD